MGRTPRSRLAPRTVLVASLIGLLSVLAPRGAAAERRERWEEPRRAPEIHREWRDWREWHGDIRHFGERDLDRWRGGHWVHGEHLARQGWWWVVGGEWYFYPAPIYPYPDPYVPPDIVAVGPPASPSQSPSDYWYYCPSAKAYYPYVPTCPEGWTPVVPQPVPPGR